MAELPKLYDKKTGTRITELYAKHEKDVNFVEMLDLDINGKIVYHKHKKDVCMFERTGYDQGCDGTVTWTIDYGVSPANPNYRDFRYQCSKGHDVQTGYPNDGRPQPKNYGDRCGYGAHQTTYTEYTCGFDAE